MATIAELMIKLGMDDSGLDQGMGSSQSKLKSWGDNLKGVGTKLTAGVTLPLVGAGAAAIKWASDQEEAGNKVDVVFGESAKGVHEWARSTEGSLLMSTAAAEESAGTFGNLFTSMGMGQGESADLSMSLVELGQDLSSFNNIPTDQALTALRAALVGEYEPMRALGVSLSQATVEQKALEMGIWDGTGALTAQQRALATYELIMEQTTNAQGDAARTANGFANQMRILRANIVDAGAKIGKIMLPYAKKLVATLIDLVDRFAELDPKWQKIILAVAAFAAVLGPVLIAIGFMLPALGALAAAFGLLISPIGLIALAIAALIGLGIYAWFNDLWGVRDIVNDIIDVFARFVDAVQMFMSQGLNPLAAALEAVSFLLASIGGESTPASIAALARLFGDLSLAAQDLGDALSNVAGDFYDAFQALSEGNWSEALYELRDAVTGLAGALLTFSGDSFIAISDWLGDMADRAGDLGPALDRLSNSARLAGEGVKHFADALSRLQSGQYDIAIGDIARGIEKIGLALLNSQMGLHEAARALVEAIARGLMDTWNGTVVPWMNTRGVELLNQASTWAYGMLEKGSLLMQQYLNGLQAGWPAVILLFDMLKGQVSQKFSEMAADAATKANELQLGVMVAFRILASGIWNHLTNIANNVKTGFDTAKTNAQTAANALQLAVMVEFRILASGIYTHVTNIANNIQTAFNNAKSYAATAMSGLASAVISTLIGLVGSAYSLAQSIGGAIGSGLVSGIQSMIGAVIAAAQSLVNAALDILSNIPGFSPIEHVGLHYGKQLGMGFAEGIAGTDRSVSGASSGLVDAAIRPLDTGVSAGFDAGQTSGGLTGNTYVSISLKSQELIDLIRNAEAGGDFARGFGQQLGLYGGTP